MQTKLTLTLEDEAIQLAKHYAKDHQTSLSKMVQSFFLAITAPEKQSRLTGIAHELSGVLKGADLLDVKAAKKARLMEKYGR